MAELVPDEKFFAFPVALIKQAFHLGLVILLDVDGDGSNYLAEMLALTIAPAEFRW